MFNIPNILERDTQIIDAPSGIGWSSFFSDPIGGTVNVRSNGVVYPEYGSVVTRVNTSAITARKFTSCGLHIRSPRTTGIELTPYQINLSCFAEDPSVTPFLFVGESPVSVTASTAGNSVTDWQLIDSGIKSGPLNVNTIVSYKENTPDRNVCFAVGLLAGSSASSNLRAFVSMSVRILDGVYPPVYDSRKL